jgi:transcriptional regulator with XRE-family HTH domain
LLKDGLRFKLEAKCSDNFMKKTKRLEDFLNEPREPLSKIPNDLFKTKTPDQQRLIIILEQVAYNLQVKSQRQLALRLNMSQPTIRGWLSGEIAEGNQIKREELQKIAKGRNISLMQLRAVFDGIDPDSIDDQTWIERIHQLPMPILLQGFALMVKRLSVLVGLGEEMDMDKIFGMQSEIEVEPEPEPEPQPHAGNQKIAQLIDAKQEDMQLGDEQFLQFLSIYGITEEDLRLIRLSTEPIPNPLIFGPISKALQMPSTQLFLLRDGESSEEEESDEQPAPKPRPSRGRKGS